VSDDEWAFVAPYLTLMDPNAPQREHSLREVFNGLRYIIRSGATWRMMPNDLPPWPAVYQQAQRWHVAGSFDAMVDDLHLVLRLAKGRTAQPSGWRGSAKAAGVLLSFFRFWPRRKNGRGHSPGVRAERRATMYNSAAFRSTPLSSTRCRTRGQKRSSRPAVPTFASAAAARRSSGRSTSP